MSKYSVRGSQDLDDRIDHDLERVRDVLWSLPQAGLLRALVLMGGYGRGEGTPLIDGDTQRPFNDYDFIVVSRPLSPCAKRDVELSLHEAQRRLEGELGIAVDLFLHTPLSLKRAEPSLLNYEMRWGHRVLKGPAEILAAVPPWNWEDIPLTEGTRLLLNRGALLLMLQENLERWLKEDRVRVVNYLMKNYLALGDCVLMVQGGYEISYSAKKGKAARVSAVDLLPDWSWYKLRYLEAIDFKEWAEPSSYSMEDLRTRFIELCHYFPEFFFWYEGRRLDVAVHDEESYAKALSRSSWNFKSLMKQVWFFGFRALRPSWRWLGIQPRYRLFCALPLLIREKINHPLISQLGVKGRFLQLWRKLR